MRARPESVLDLGPLRSAFDLAPIGLAVMSPVADGEDFRYGYVNPMMQGLAPATPMLGRTYGELHPDTRAEDLPRLREVFRGAPPWIRPESVWPVRGADTGGRCFRIEISRIDMEGEQRLFQAATEVTAEVRTREALEQRAELESRRTALLLRAAGLLASSTDLAALLRGVVSVLLEASGRRRAVVSLYDAERGALVVRATEGPVSIPSGTRIPLEDLSSPVHRSLVERVTVLVDYEEGGMLGEFKRVAARWGLKLALSVPLVLGEEVVGHVLLDDPGERRPFSARDIETMEGIATTAAAAIWSGRLLAAERLRAERLARLKQLTDIATSSLEPGEVAERTLRYFSEGLGVDATTLWAVDRERRRLRPLTGVGFPPAFYEQFASGIGLDEPYDAATAYREGRPVVRPSERIEEVPEPVRATYAKYGVKLRALLVLPVGHGSERPVGAVTLAWSTPHELDEDEVAFFSSAVSTLTIATENARLYEERSRSANVAEQLAAASYLFMTSPVEEAVPAALRRATETLGAVGALVARREDGGWRTASGYGMEGIGEYYTDAESPMRTRMLETRQPAMMPDVLAVPGADVELAQRQGYRSYVAHPLLFGDRVIGAITFFFREPREGFSETESYFMTRMVYVISAALENARLFEARRRQAEYAQALNRINDELHSTLDFDEIMKRVVVDLSRALDVDASGVHMRENGRWRFTYSHGLPEGLRAARLTDDQANISLLALRSRETVVVNDAANDPRANRELMARFSISALLAVPLIVREEIVGVLVAGCFGRPHTFTAEQADFAEKVAASLSLALENARLYQAEHRIAETLQEALISLPDNIDGLEFAHAYRSAAEAARVGGDFYDMFELADGSVGIMIGDVAGKGLDAAVLTSLVKNAVRAHSVEPGKSPARVLQLTNELVVRSTPVEAFVTVFLGVLDCRAGTLTYTNAGHTTGVIVREDGALLPLPAESPLLGAFPDVDFAGSVAPMEAGATLFLYTDGLVEARRDHDLFGEERLLDVLRDAPGRSPRALVRVAIDSVRDFTGDRLTDDLAILAVQRLPK